MSKQKIKDQIKCCPGCYNPLIFTFIVPGAEYFCMSCKGSFGIFYGIRTPHTKELQKQYNELKAQFDKASEHFVPGGCTKEGCIKCTRQKEANDKYHIWHLKEDEMKLHLEAKEQLFGKD